MRDPADVRAEGAEEVEEMPVEVMVPKFDVVPMAERDFDCFLTHFQGTGQDQTGALGALLKAQGCKCWLDMQAQDLTATGMEKGVSQSRCMLIFLSDGYMGRRFCNMELRWARPAETLARISITRTHWTNDLNHSNQ